MFELRLLATERHTLVRSDQRSVTQVHVGLQRHRRHLAAQLSRDRVGDRDGYWSSIVTESGIKMPQ
jgi:hypothetical protein